MPTVREDVKQGVIEGIQSLLKDPKVMESFWHGGYQELIKHGSNNANQWVGRRILTGLITALTIAGLVWMVNNGAIK